MMKKTLAAIARDRRCQALVKLMASGRDRIRGTWSRPQSAANCPTEFKKKPDNLFRDL